MIIRTDQKLVYNPNDGPPRQWAGLPQKNSAISAVPSSSSGPALGAVPPPVPYPEDASSASAGSAEAPSTAPVIEAWKASTSRADSGSGGKGNASTSTSTSTSKARHAVEAGAGVARGAGGGSVSASSPATHVETVFQLLSGSRVKAMTSLDAPLQTVCDSDVAPAVGRPTKALRLIFRQKVVSMEDHGRSLGLVDGSVIHVVLQSVDVDAPGLTAEGVAAHCPVCHTMGSRFKARPLCPACGTEEVMLAPGSVALPRTGGPP